MKNERLIALSESESELLYRLSILPIKILSQIPPDDLKKATEKLIENGLLEPEDIPTKEDMEALDRLADRIGIPSLKDVMMDLFRDKCETLNFLVVRDEDNLFVTAETINRTIEKLEKRIAEIEKDD